MIVKTLSLDYTPDALNQRFAPIADQPWAMLLSSANADHSDNRFDILTADPRATLVTRGDITQITDASGTIESREDPLLLLQQQCDALGVTPVANATLPFQEARWACSATIWAAGLSSCRSRRRPISLPRIWRWAFMTGH